MDWTVFSKGLWVGVVGLGCYSFLLFGRAWKSGKENPLGGHREAERVFNRGIGLLRSGLPLDQQFWEQLDSLPLPWGGVAPVFLREIRSQGGKLLAPLSRMEHYARYQREFLADAQSRAAPAVGQAWVAFFLVLGGSAGLYTILSEVSQRKWQWWGVTGISMSLSWFAVLWIRELADRAIHLGVTRAHRWEGIWAGLAGEGVLALVRGGMPGDLAWTLILERLQKGAPRLAETWGAIFWDPVEVFHSSNKKDLATTLGHELREILRAALLEGRSASDGIDAALQRNDFQRKVLLDQQLRLLTNQVLLPLFLLIVPAVLLLLGVALFWVFEATDWVSG